jgi:hypothetical protein
VTPRAKFVRVSAVALAALSLFSLGFSLLAERGLWPELPPGALHDTDLVAGFAAAAALAALLLFDRGRSTRPTGSVPDRRGSTPQPQDGGRTREP